MFFLPNLTKNIENRNFDSVVYKLLALNDPKWPIFDLFLRSHSNEY